LVEVDEGGGVLESKKVERARREEAKANAKATPRKQPARDADAKPLVKKRKRT